MPMKYIYWMLVILWVDFGFGGFLMPFGPYTATAGHIGSLLELVLFILLGWKVFGAAVEG